MTSLLETLIDSSLGGVPGNAIWDLIKYLLQKANKKSPEEKLLDSFFAALPQILSEKEKKSLSIELNRSELKRILHQDLELNPDVFSAPHKLDKTVFAKQISEELEKNKVLIFYGKDVSQEKHKHYIEKLVSIAQTRFREALLNDQQDINRVIFDREDLEKISGNILALYSQIQTLATSVETNEIRTILLQLKEKIQDQSYGSDVYFQAPTPPRHPLIGGLRLVNEIITNHLKPEKIIALSGITGIGKTVVATSIANHPLVLEKYKNGVIWIEVGKTEDENDPRVIAQLRSLANLVGISEYDQNILSKAGWKALQSGIKSKIRDFSVLIVIDDIWQCQVAKNFMVGGPNSSTIITTHIQTVAHECVGENNTVEIKEPSVSDCVDWLKKEVPRLNKPKYTNRLKELVEVIGAYPFSILIISILLPLFFEWIDDQSFNIHQIIDKSKNRTATLLEKIYEHLTIEVRKFFIELSVFPPNPNHFTANNIHEILGLEESVVRDHLATLKDHHLININYPRKFSLSPVVYDFARKKLVDSGSDDIYRKMANYYSRYIQLNQHEFFLLDKEFNNIRAAIENALKTKLTPNLIKAITSISDYLDNRGFNLLALKWLNKAIQDALIIKDEDLLHDGYYFLGRITQKVGNLQEAKSYMELALQIDENDVRALYSLAQILISLNIEDKEIVNNLDKAILLAKNTNDFEKISRCLGVYSLYFFHKALNAKRESNNVLAIEYFNNSKSFIEEQIFYAGEIKNSLLSTEITDKGWSMLAVIDQNIGNYDLVYSYYNKVLESGKKNNNQDLILSQYLNLASLFWEQQQPLRAKRFAFRALREFEGTYHHNRIGGAHIILADIYFTEGKRDKADKHLKAAILAAESSNDQYLISVIEDIKKKYGLDQSLGFSLEEEEEQEVADRSYWEKRGSVATVSMADRVLQLIKDLDPELELKYNKFYIGVAKYNKPFNFVLFRPKVRSLRIEPKIQKSDEIEDMLDSAGMDVLEYDSRNQRYRIQLSRGDIDEHGPLLKELLKRAYREFNGYAHPI